MIGTNFWKSITMHNVMRIQGLERGFGEIEKIGKEDKIYVAISYFPAGSAFPFSIMQIPDLK